MIPQLFTNVRGRPATTSICKTSEVGIVVRRFTVLVPPNPSKMASYLGKFNGRRLE